MDELADGTHAAVAEMVDVVGLHARVAVVELDQALNDFVDVAHQQDAHVEARWVHGAIALVQVLVELVATDLGQVVAALREEVRLEQRFCVVEGRWVTRAQALVELDQGFFGVVRIVFVERGTQVLVLVFFFEGAKHRFDVLVVAIAGQFAVVAPAAFAVGLGAPRQYGTEQHGDGDFAFAVDLDRYNVAAVGLELEPGATVGDELGRVQVATGVGVTLGAEVDARRTNQLRDDHTLGAVDDKGAVFGHQGEVAQEGVGLFDFARAQDAQLHADAQGCRVGQIVFAAFVLVVARRAKSKLAEAQFEVFAGEIGNWRNFAEQLLQAFGSKPVKTGNLCFDEIGYVNCVALLTEGVPQFAFFGTGSVGKNQRWQCDMDILRRHGNLASIGR